MDIVSEKAFLTTAIYDVNGNPLSSDNGRLRSKLNIGLSLNLFAIGSLEYFTLVNVSITPCIRLVTWLDFKPNEFSSGLPSSSTSKKKSPTIEANTSSAILLINFLFKVALLPLRLRTLLTISINPGEEYIVKLGIISNKNNTEFL